MFSVLEKNKNKVRELRNEYKNDHSFSDWIGFSFGTIKFMDFSPKATKYAIDIIRKEHELHLFDRSYQEIDPERIYDVRVYRLNYFKQNDRGFVFEEIIYEYENARFVSYGERVFDKVSFDMVGTNKQTEVEEPFILIKENNKDINLSDGNDANLYKYGFCKNMHHTKLNDNYRVYIKEMDKKKFGKRPVR